MDVNCHKPEELLKTIQLQHDQIQQVCNSEYATRLLYFFALE